MMNWLRRKRNRAEHEAEPQPIQPDEGEALREAAREAQELRLELAEREETLARLRAELAEARLESNARAENVLGDAEARWLTDLAAPVAQLLTQAHLVHVARQPVRTADVLAVASRLIVALQDHGLEIVGAVGNTTTYDPECHETLDESVELAPGDTVTMRFVGLAHRGQTIHRAGVERSDSSRGEVTT